jgi:hypothetical protein
VAPFRRRPGDDHKLHLYVDGALEASSDEEAANFNDTSYRAFLGVNIEETPRYFRGLMDEFRFWNDARTKEEINSGLNSPIDQSTQGLVAGYDFNLPASVLAPHQKPGNNLSMPAVVRESLNLSPVTVSP